MADQVCNLSAPFSIFDSPKRKVLVFIFLNLVFGKKRDVYAVWKRKDHLIVINWLITQKIWSISEFVS